MGFKIENERAVQFRKWANQIVKDYTIQGWVMDVDRLKSGGSILTDEFFERQLEKIREIRLSERKFYQKITDSGGSGRGAGGRVVRAAPASGDAAFPRPALDYLNDWAAPDKGWLRKFYKPGTDEAQFDLTPATEKAIDAHASVWGVKDKPVRADLPRLTPEELMLYDDLRDNRIRPGLRLEQEHVGFGWVNHRLQELLAR